MRNKSELGSLLIASTLPYALYSKLREEAEKNSFTISNMAKIIIKEFIDDSSKHHILQKQYNEPNVTLSITNIDLSMKEALDKIAAETDNSKSYVIYKFIEEYFKDRERGEQ